MSARTIFRSMNLIMNMNCKCYFNRVWEMGPALFTYAARNSMGPRHPSTIPWELTQRAAILTAQPASLTQDCEQSHHLTCLCPVCAALSSSTLCCSGSCPGLSHGRLHIDIPSHFISSLLCCHGSRFSSFFLPTFPSPRLSLLDNG